MERTDGWVVMGGDSLSLDFDGNSVRVLKCRLEAVFSYTGL